MTLSHALFLLCAAGLAGALNSVAGGGSFVSFPALLFTGVPPVNANATSTVALWPGSVASASAYRRQFSPDDRSQISEMAIISLVGGLVGALVLLHTPQAAFMRLVPYLLFVATLIFALGKTINRALASHLASPGGKARLAAGTGLLQFLIAVYGGFFGAGIGILMLALLSLMGGRNVNSMNAYKNLLASCINGVAVVTFAVAGAVKWPQATLMMLGSVAGGYGAGHYAQKVDPRLVHRFVIATGCVMSVYFLMKQA